MKVHAYLNFPGNGAEAFEFYRSVFGGEFPTHVRFRDMPMEGVDIPEADQDKAMHIALPIGDGNLLMASDALEALGQTVHARQARPANPLRGMPGMGYRSTVIS